MGVLAEVGEGGLSVEVEGQEGVCPVFWTCLEMTAKRKDKFGIYGNEMEKNLKMYCDRKQTIPWVSLWD